MQYYVYLLLLEDRRIYVGSTNNPPRRMLDHARGKGSRTTGLVGVRELIYQEVHPDRASAVCRERQLKGWTRAKKLALASGNITELKNLARRRTAEG